MLKRSLAFLVVVFALVFNIQPLQAQDAVVRAVLFYSPTCGHCHQVMTVDLPPLQEKYGDQLMIMTIDSTTPQGQAYYEMAFESLENPPDSRGVPALFIDDRLLIGSLQIPEEFPG